MPSKRSHGEGTLRHRSDGRWELRMMDGYQKDGSPRFKTFYGKTQKEVKLKLKEYQDALISGVQLDTILYFEDWADTWFEGHRDNIAPTTQESYKYCLKMLKEGFYHRPLTVIRPIDIENFLKGMRRDGRSDSYISKARGMLYQIFQKAEANDLVRRNPVRLAEKMRASGTAKRKEAFTTAEVAHLMKVLPDDRMGLSIRLLLGTGMRMQELLALEPQFIEEDGSVIHIRQAVKVVKGTVSIGSPKSKDSIRDIPVPLNVRPCAIKLAGYHRPVHLGKPQDRLALQSHPFPGCIPQISGRSGRCPLAHAAQLPPHLCVADAGVGRGHPDHPEHRRPCRHRDD